MVAVKNAKLKLVQVIHLQKMIYLVITYHHQTIWNEILPDTGKSLSEALIFALIKPQSWWRQIFHLIMSSVHENWKLRTSSEHVVYTNCFCSVLFWHSEQVIYTTCSEHILSLQFSCTELAIQWTIFCHIVG